MSVQNINLFWVFSGSALAVFAYFFVGTSLYTVLTVLGGAIMLLPLLFNFAGSVRFAGRVSIGRVAFLSLFFSVVVTSLYWLDRGGHSDSLLVGDLYQMSLAILFFCVGFSLELSERLFSALCVLYGLLLSMLGFVMMKYLGGGFEEVGAQYSLGFKNALCVGWASAGAILFWCFFYGYKTQVLRWFGGIGFLGILLCILYARGRAAFCALVVFCLVVLCRRYGRGNWLVIGGIIASFSLGLWAYLALCGAPQLLVDSFLKNRNVSDLNDVSSGRIDLMLLGIDNFISYPFFGGGDINAAVHVHCYPVRVLSSRGLFGSFGYLFFYFSLFVIWVKEIFQKKPPQAGDVGRYLIGILLLVSLGEVSMPFGPGTISAICFILLGASMRTNCSLPHKFSHDGIMPSARNRYR